MFAVLLAETECMVLLSSVSCKENVHFYRVRFFSVCSESVGLYSGNVRAKGREWKMYVFEQGWGELHGRLLAVTQVF